MSEETPIPMRPTQMMTYPILLRPGVWARAILPEDLNKREAARFCAMVETLALPDEELAS